MRAEFEKLLAMARDAGQSTLPIDRDAKRRAAIFAIDIGLPLAVGTALGDARAALLGAVTGLLFSFADNDGPLAGRLTVLAMAGGGLALGGTLGRLLGGYTPAFWIVFAVAAFATGWLYGGGKGPMLAARFGSMALAVTAGLSGFEFRELAYVGGAFGLAVAVRLFDHRMFGALPQLQPPPRSSPADVNGWARFALAYSVAAMVGLWIGIALDPARAIWVTTTTLVVMAPDAQASYVRIVERIEGAFFGVAAAWLLSLVLDSAALLCIAVLLVAPTVPHHLANRYWLHTALIAMLILLANDLAEFGLHGGHTLYLERLQDMIFGCGLALVGTAAAFPRRTDRRS